MSVGHVDLKQVLEVPADDLRVVLVVAVVVLLPGRELPVVEVGGDMVLEVPLHLKRNRSMMISSLERGLRGGGESLR